ncbi:MAG TPA: tol-pal system protein YbgF [Gemmatimonadaceae bacterium]|nr:tol-pal system protein YbgF [Gemmatimonadaceae bacterium]
MSSLRTATESDLTAMKEDISQLRDLSGVSEQRLRDMRAALEEKAVQPEPTVGTDTAATGGNPPASGPGPGQLLQAGRDQLLKGGNVAARAAFSELIAKYPKSDLVPEAMFFTAQAYAAERNNAAADKEYSALIARYPSSPRVPTAMYKRALQLQAAKRTAEAKKLFQDIIKRFPRSDEAALADERLQQIR